MFFHATETIKHNKSFIMALKNNDGLEVTKHEDKATILWEAFRDILGSSDFTHMHFNLEDLIQIADSLDELVQPILKEEIDNIVKNLLSGKSPGPDDFNIYYGKNAGILLPMTSMKCAMLSTMKTSVCRVLMAHT
jgi:hypothetical protein